MNYFKYFQLPRVQAGAKAVEDRINRFMLHSSMAH